MPIEQKQAENRKISKHTLTMQCRENIDITGVLDVISFDEEIVVMETDQGLLILKGDNLHVNNLNLDNGNLSVDGEISSIVYEDSANIGKGKSSIFGKIFK